MKEQIKYAAKLSASAFFTFIKINLIGTVLSLAAIITGFILLSKNIDGGSPGHVSALNFLTIIFTSRPVGTVLWAIMTIASSILIFSLGNKYVTQKIINRIITDKSGGTLEPLFEKVFKKFKAHQPDVVRSNVDLVMEKLKMIDAVKAETENKWLKRIIVYGIKRANLDDINFTKEGLSFYDMIKAKAIQALQEVTQPGKTFFFIIIAANCLIVLFIWLTKW